MKLPSHRESKDSDVTFERGPIFKLKDSKLEGKERRYCELINGHMKCRKMTDYECKLEEEVDKLQDALFRLTSHYAKIQFRLRQISKASGCERTCLLQELDRMICQGLDGKHEYDELPSLLEDSQSMGDVRLKQQNLIKQLRGRLENLAEATRDCFQAERNSTMAFEQRCICHDVRLRKSGLNGEGDIDIHKDGKHHANAMQGDCRRKLPPQRYLPETWAPLDVDTGSEASRPSRKSSKSRKGKSKSKSKPVIYPECACPAYPDTRPGPAPPRSIDMHVDYPSNDEDDKHVPKQEEPRTSKKDKRLSVRRSGSARKSGSISSSIIPNLDNLLQRHSINSNRSYTSNELNERNGLASVTPSQRDGSAAHYPSYVNNTDEDEEADDEDTHDAGKNSPHATWARQSRSSSSVYSIASQQESQSSARNSNQNAAGNRAPSTQSSQSTYSTAKSNNPDWSNASKGSIYSAATSSTVRSYDRSSANASVQTNPDKDKEDASNARCSKTGGRRSGSCKPK